MIVLEIVAAVLVADFVSGLFHWLEDAYGREHWPITGRLVTRPNILHHHEPRHFTRHGWFHSARLLLVLGVVVLVVAWLCGVLTWQVWLVVLLGVNANEIHKWAHRTPSENGLLISILQRIRLIQTPRHHAHHHTDPKSSHYCVLTDFLNPLLDGIRFWAALEWSLRKVFGVRRRIDQSVLVGRHDARNHPEAKPIEPLCVSALQTSPLAMESALGLRGQNLHRFWWKALRAVKSHAGVPTSARGQSGRQ